MSHCCEVFCVPLYLDLNPGHGTSSSRNVMAVVTLLCGVTPVDVLYSTHETKGLLSLFLSVTPVERESHYLSDILGF